ncbi:TRAP transporter 4TM/12TM fusion protein [Evansella vedderi]|uniref:TRAP transporter 4TM/12TM fusion protein n=1 Tax=Evansella vedderi TaxID=38282 RepID=A0ABU0A345_9BACI|nr:TRAP transporter permease [Evansella vedderi]MDQ0257078.1 TRAP transporter 4TM/12TM fusion protein [Evansella vedderi]
MNKVLKWTVGSIALCMALFHLYAAGVQLFPAVQQRSAHLGFALALIFLIYPFIKKQMVNEDKLKIHNYIGLLINIMIASIAIAASLYIFINHIELTRNLALPSTLVVVIATFLIIMTLEATRRTVGWGLPAVAIVFLIYVFYGQHLPLMFAHTGYRFEHIVTHIGLSTEGILGISLGVSATYIVLFVIFGSLLERSGAGQLFINLAMGLVGRFRGGAAKVSIVSSAFFGSISGSPSSNVVTTGVLTIPLMKKQGYKPEYAAAVESISSTGGMFLPPVMGAVSFLIADFLGVPYTSVVFAAIIPAILYFMAVFIMVDLRAVKLGWNVSIKEEGPDLKKELKQKGHLLIPLFILIYLLLIERASPTLSAFWAIVSIPLCTYLRKDTRMGIRKIIQALQQGIRVSLMVVAACACAGIVIGVINMTGIGLRLSSILINLAGENLFLLLLLTMVVSIIMGLGLPPVASYIILSVFAAPAMIQLGVSAMAAHMFIFFYATLAHITPPVAVTVFAASGLANSSPTKTSIITLRLGLVAFIVPYLFVYGPQLLFEGPLLNVLYAAFTSIIGVFVLSVALEGFLKSHIKLLARLLMLTSAVLMMHVDYVTDIIGVVIATFILFIELKVKKNENPLPTQTSSIG